MSWFLTVLKFTPEGKQWKPDETFPENGLAPLGTREEIHALIAKLFPEAKFSDPTWITVSYPVGNETWGMEIVLDDADPVEWLGLRRGTRQAARLIHEHTGWDVLEADHTPINFDSPDDNAF